MHRYHDTVRGVEAKSMHRSWTRASPTTLRVSRSAMSCYLTCKSLSVPSDISGASLMPVHRPDSFAYAAYAHVSSARLRICFPSRLGGVCASYALFACSSFRGLPAFLPAARCWTSGGARRATRKRACEASRTPTSAERSGKTLWLSYRAIKDAVVSWCSAKRTVLWC